MVFLTTDTETLCKSGRIGLGSEDGLTYALNFVRILKWYTVKEKNMVLNAPELCYRDTYAVESKWGSLLDSNSIKVCAYVKGKPKTLTQLESQLQMIHHQPALVRPEKASGTPS